MALPTVASADFGADKPAGVPCRHLRRDDRCEIHASLRDLGWPGCVAFDCFGAGQRATVAAGPNPWRGRLEDPGTAGLFAAFGTLRRLHEMDYLVRAALDHLGGSGGPAGEPVPAGEAARTGEPAPAGEAAPGHPGHAGPGDLRAALERLRDRLTALAAEPMPELCRIDVSGVRADVAATLTGVADWVRGARRTAGEWSGREPRDVRARADLIGARLAGRDLRTLNLRGALLIAADLRGADLRWADLLGADLRDADLGGANLSEALFVSPPQVAAARGNATTRLPRTLVRPAHWSGTRE